MRDGGIAAPVLTNSHKKYAASKKIRFPKIPYFLFRNYLIGTDPVTFLL